MGQGPLLMTSLILALGLHPGPVDGQWPCPQLGWFGGRCLYPCRCLNDLDCDVTSGTCDPPGCLPGWFGPSCQYADLARDRPVTVVNGTGSQRDVADGNDDTCAITSVLELDLDRKYFVNWVRLISTDTRAWSRVRVYLVVAASNSTTECTGPGSAVTQWVGGGVVDVHCEEGVAGDRVRLVSDNDISVICSLHVSGGRNVAVRGNSSQLGTLFPFSADLAVDGDADRSPTSGSCSYTSDNALTFQCSLVAMTADPWWQVILPTEVKASRFVLYPREGNEAVLEDVQLFSGNPTYSLVFQQPADQPVPDVIVVSLDRPVRLDRAALQVPGQCRIIEMCEVEVYGESLCPEGRYGLECQGRCACRDVTEVCQPITGGCVSGCPDGFTGVACDQKCTSTQYGRDCSRTCSEGCREKLCDHVTGNCTLGCEDGWLEEPKCENACDSGFWGPNCSQKCPENCLGTCNSIGICEKCQPGYKGFKCDQECDLGSYGPDCGEQCSFHCVEPKCNHMTGACACRSGWKLPVCIDPCDVTTWGPNCTQTCEVGCQQQDCDAINGQCQFGCGDGYLGDFCKQKCGPGRFGQECGETCSSRCLDQDCHHVTGTCTNCPPGFQGDLCDTPCGLGQWGSRCRDRCSANCGGDDQACSATDGTCNAGCAVGYKGIRCTETCGSGKFGQNCTKSCSANCLPATASSSPCDHVTGNCPQGCVEGFEGASCFKATPTSAAMVGGVVGGLVVAVVVILVVAFIIFRRRKNKSMTPERIEENGNTPSPFVNINHAYVTDGKDGIFDDEDEASDRGISMATGSDNEQEKQTYYNTCADLSRTRLASRDLSANLDKWRVDPTPLIEQFENLPKGLISTTSIALNVSNKTKNRYKNICAYDHSRVKLNLVDGDPNSDYINACHVNGYDGEPKFIASQGPNAVILNDFVRMLWEKRIGTVVMLTNTYEGGKHKCEQYWPDSGEKKYGSVTVSLLSVRMTADYVIRSLQLTKDGRKVDMTQHHFTSWPDKGVPFSPWPLVDFHMIVTAHAASQPPDTPIVVHCSAGIGRTGTYIALDNLMAESAATLNLDFNTCVWKLRQARVNMIQTPEQYLFLHEAVLVGQTVAGTMLTKEQLPDAVDELKKPTAEGFSKLAGEFKRLGVCQSKVNEDEYQAGRMNENITKNRYYNILPKDSHRPILTSSVAGTNDYINAVFLPGYRKRSHFIVTQMPLASTVLDLWRLVGEYPVSTIVTFPSNPTTVGDTAPEFLPEEGQTCQFGPYKVTGRSHTQHDHYHEAFVHMIKSKRLSLGRNGRTLHVLKCEDSTPGPDLMLSVAQAAVFGLSDKQLTSSFVLVVCRTGAEMSGVFVALAQLIQRLGEAPVSVPTVVGHLRTVRPQLLATLEQYQALYEALKTFAVNSSVYSNLQAPPSDSEGTPPVKPKRRWNRDRGQGRAEGKESRAERKVRRGANGAAATNGSAPSPKVNGGSQSDGADPGVTAAAEDGDSNPRPGSDDMGVVDSKGHVNFAL